MADWTIGRLNKDHAREAFSCGNASLDLFLRDLAGQYEKRGIGRTFVATQGGEKTVRGYYTWAAGSLDLSALPDKARKKLPKHPLPTVHLGRLAVDQTAQGQKLGETLLFHFLHGAWEMSQTVGVFAVDGGHLTRQDMVPLPAGAAPAGVAVR